MVTRCLSDSVKQREFNINLAGGGLFYSADKYDFRDLKNIF